MSAFANRSGTPSPTTPVQVGHGNGLLLWAGFILVALNLRLIFATVGPLLQDLALGFTGQMLVTALPVLLLSIFSIPGVWLRQYFGEERTLFCALALLCLGCGVRGFGEGALIAGTVLGSAGIAVMNVVMPALARKRFGPQRMGMVMGIYALMLGMGAVLGASLAFPLFQALGGDRQAAFQSLGWWAIPALAALLVWAPQLRQGVAQAKSGMPVLAGKSASIYRNSTAWSVTLFFGLQALNLYVFLPWMPTILMDRGSTPETAALVFSASQFSLMVGSFVMPLLAARAREQRWHIVATVLLCLAGTLGLGYAPIGSAWVWAVLLGFGQGAGPALGALLFLARSASAETATRLSAMAQTVGYLIAVAGPLMIGYLYKRAGDWNLAIGILALILLLELMVALPAGRNLRIP